MTLALMCRDAMEAELHQFEDQVREIEDQIRLGHPSSLVPPLKYSEIMIGFSGSITASPPWQMAELTLLTLARRWILTSRLLVTFAYMATIHLATWDLSNCMSTSLDDFMCSIHICYCCFCNCLWCSATAPSWQRARAHVGRHRAEESW